MARENRLEKDMIPTEIVKKRNRPYRSSSEI